LLALLFGAKMLPKLALVLPLARRHVPEHATFTTLLMSTGLTFGTISSLYGLNAHIIDRTQFSLLVTVVMRGSGVTGTVGLAAVGYGIGLLVAGVFLAVGHNPLRRRP
jgi:hypothetical protein